ncbi:MAG: SLBB domain-containing protein [Planctomycetales bacterium]|nr:SLBB domain-containing protein [Planctomycetales bacterium]
MMTHHRDIQPLASPCEFRLRRPSKAAALAAFFAVLIGCQTPAYKAATLPAEYRALGRARSKLLDLSQAASAGPANSRIAAGDLLEVTVVTGLDTDEPVVLATRVDDDGSVDVQPVGRVILAGLEPQHASATVAAAAVERGIYRRPNVSVEITSRAVNHVTVLGAVSEPGVHKLPKGSSDLISALAAAGGLTDEAGAEVEIIRQSELYAQQPGSPANPKLDRQGEGEVVPASFQHVAGQPGAASKTVLDLTDASSKAFADCSLGDRDVIVVRPREADLLYVGGLVFKPGQYELPTEQELHLLDAVMLAGGVSSTVADKVLVIRRPPDDGEPIAIRASLREAKRNGAANLVMAPGDMVSIEQTPATAMVDAFNRVIRLTFGVASQTSVF